MKRILLLNVLVLSVMVSAIAQRTVSGKVTDESGESLPGVNVLIQGTTTGTQTDLDGNFRISVDDGATLIFSYVGFESQEIPVGARTVIDISMGGSTQLEEVVVTALGIERKKEALGFAVSSVSSDEVAEKTEGDFVRSLRSKASGVNITQQSGLSGSATNIVVRGYTSLLGNNQPLFIVDGVPFNINSNTGVENDDGTSGTQTFESGTNTGSSRFLDLDPNNIADIKILKGLAAATLYGTQGRNGVVLITTKSGAANQKSSKTEVTLTQSVFANQVASLPDYQDAFGNGFDQAFGWFFSNWGPSFNETGLGGWGDDVAISREGFEGLLPHPYSQYSDAALRDVFPEFTDPNGVPGRTVNGEQLFGVPYEWTPYNSVEDFFRTGLVVNTSLNVRGGKEGFSYNFNYGYLNDEGFTPGNELERQTFGIGANYTADNGLTFATTMNYSRTDFSTPPVAASQGNGAGLLENSNATSIFGHLFFTPRSVDLMGLPFSHPLTGASVYYRNGNDIQNPRWTSANAFGGQLTNRFFGTFSASYNLTENISTFYRLGVDFYNEANDAGQNKGGVEGYLNGFYRTFDNRNIIWDQTVGFNGSFQLGPRLGLDVNIGATARRQDFERQGVFSEQQLVFGTFRHFNFIQQQPIQYSEEQNILGLFGQAELNWDGLIYLTLAGRSDWVSNFSEDNRSIFYPSVSTSFLLSDMISSVGNSPVVDALKLRVGYGTSAGFRSGYPISTNLTLDSRYWIDEENAVVSSNTTGTQLGNPDLEPELHGELEVGIEARLLSNRVSFDMSLYRRTVTDQIVELPLDPSTGFTSTFANIGEIENKGLEVDLGVDIIRLSNGLTWNLRNNFTIYRSEVTDLGDNDNLENIFIAGFTNRGNFAVKGEPIGVMLGTRILRNDDGDFVVNSQGSYEEEAGLFKIGDPTPDFTTNFLSTLSYKGFTFSAVINWVQGGDMWSSTVATLLGRGLTTDTEDRVQSFILPGVVNRGTTDSPDYQPNDIQINNSTYYFSNILFGPDELQVFDATVVRLQEISLSYSLPQTLLANTPFGNVTFTASGFNLWYNAPNVPEGTNFDPNVAGLGVGNGQGFDYLNGPSSKRYGGSLKLTF
ncbi:MAG: SusC/RagA family TonB-linked outer membrane protein [Bacteroidota bacterium]